MGRNTVTGSELSIVSRILSLGLGMETGVKQGHEAEDETLADKSGLQ